MLSKLVACALVGIVKAQEPAMCDGTPVSTVAQTGQLIAFGCIENEVLQCAYSANADPDNYPGAWTAFQACRSNTGGGLPCSTRTEEASQLHAQGSCPGASNNGGGVGIAFHTIIPFTTGCTDVYHFRFHADYGRGGYIGINNGATGTINTGTSNNANAASSGTMTSGDIWGHVEINDVALTSGNHIFEGLGFEGCCDGHAELDLMMPDGGIPGRAAWVRVKSGGLADFVMDCPSGLGPLGVDSSGASGCYVVMGAAAGETNVDIGNSFFTLTGTVTTTDLDGLIFHAIHITTHPGCGNCMPGDNWITVEVVNDAGNGKMRGSIATCSMTGGNAASSASEAHVMHDTVVSDGADHTFIFEKGSPGTNLGPGCIELNVDGGTAVGACNSECSWIESDTMYFGGVPGDFNRFHQGADQTTALFGGGGGTWVAGWDATWDDDAILSTSNFKGALGNLQYSIKSGVRGRGAGVTTNDVDVTTGVCSGGGCTPSAVIIMGAAAGETNIDIGNSFFTLTGNIETTSADGLIFHAIHITTHPGCGNCMPGDNWITLEIVNEGGVGKLRGSIATCSMTGGQAAVGASEAHVINPTPVSDGVSHSFLFEKGSPGTDLGPGCVSVIVDGGTAIEACNSECSWVESDTIYFGGVPDDFNRFHQGADQGTALFGGGGGNWVASWDATWDDDAILSTRNFEGMISALAYSIKSGVRGRGTGVTTVPVDWAAAASCGGGDNFTPIDVSAFVLSGSAQIDAASVISVTQVAGGQAGTAFAPVDVGPEDTVVIRFELYCGDGSGADGLCMNLGVDSMGGRVGEDGVAVGVASCFDEWANGGDHGVMLFYNGATVWEDVATCNNRQGCLPVSLFEDAVWHDIEVTIIPSCGGGVCGAALSMDMDSGAYGGSGDIAAYTLPAPTFLGFSGRTGGATNNHWIRSVFVSSTGAAADVAGAPGFTGWCSAGTTGGGTCTTVAGTACVFPFQYNGNTYTSCTAADWNQPWCSTDAVYAGNWGNCEACNTVNSQICAFEYMYHQNECSFCPGRRGLLPPGWRIPRFPSFPG